MALSVTTLPILNDNYIHIIECTESKKALVVDPGVAAPVIQYFKEQGLTCEGILLTHHHWDHVEGVEELTEKLGASTYGYAKDQIRLPSLTHPMADEESFTFQGHEVQVLYTPGHTLGHICYHIKDSQLLFCGDTLFVFGCGRLFEGSPLQMLKSLAKISSLHESTQVYCTHEYTLSNLEFCLEFDPPNKEQLNSFYQTYQKQRKLGQSTVPAQLKEQVLWNPFLREASHFQISNSPAEQQQALEKFTYLRKMKDQF